MVSAALLLSGISCSTPTLELSKRRHGQPVLSLTIWVERQHRRVPAAHAGLHQQNRQVPDTQVAEPSQVLGIFELSHHELRDELGQRIRRTGHFLLVDDRVGGKPGKGVVTATPLQEALEEAQRR